MSNIKDIYKSNIDFIKPLKPKDKDKKANQLIAKDIILRLNKIIDECHATLVTADGSVFTTNDGYAFQVKT